MQILSESPVGRTIIGQRSQKAQAKIPENRQRLCASVFVFNIHFEVEEKHLLLDLQKPNEYHRGLFCHQYDYGGGLA
jgi:hypothetical protein